MSIDQSPTTPDDAGLLRRSRRSATAFRMFYDRHAARPRWTFPRPLTRSCASATRSSARRRADSWPDGAGITYHCTLSRLPGPEIRDHRGSKELIAIDGRIAGGCIGQDEAGLTWDCFVGEEAVRRGILVEDLLGQPMLAPGRG